jgi:hypothetical protein
MFILLELWVLARVFHIAIFSLAWLHSIVLTPSRMIGTGMRRPCFRESARSDMLALSRATRLFDFRGVYSEPLSNTNPPGGPL